MTSLFGSAQVYSSERNEFISSKHQMLAEIIHDYNPFFSVVYIPKRDRDETDTKPFAILSQEPMKPPHIIKFLTEREMDDPESVLRWLFEGDVNKHRPNEIFARMEARRLAQEVWKAKKDAEETEDRQEMFSQVLKGGVNRLNTYRHNGVKYQ